MQGCAKCSFDLSHNYVIGLQWSGRSVHFDENIQGDILRSRNRKRQVGQIKGYKFLANIALQVCNLFALIVI